MGPRAIDHVNIVVQDMDRSIAFYTEALGFEQYLETTIQGPWVDAATGIEGARAHCVYLDPPEGGCRLELIQYLEPPGESWEPGSAPNSVGLRHFALSVQDLDGTVETLKARDVKFVSDPLEVPAAVGLDQKTGRKRMCYFLDPDGAIIELAEYAPID